MQPKEDTMTPLRQKMLEDMQLHGLSERTQQSNNWDLFSWQQSEQYKFCIRCHPHIFL
jgi:hypothetical protein